MAEQGTYKAAVWKRDLVSMLPRCTPNNSRLDSSKLLNTFPLDTPVCFLLRACRHGMPHWAGPLKGPNSGGGEEAGGDAVVATAGRECKEGGGTGRGGEG